ncbi:amidohydrolase [Geodermatophilus sabuli]|uniref:Amidohydrolase n=1 Tax=Geodermatophilus sabuli TaxID=1564158 RepID=A0A7K3W0N9_9ACTN|nr:amidohydrolase family protein [Geodermatophilus sabuli]NEK58436.1 amidohydrolase [Geodermatophilus sabuli]
MAADPAAPVIDVHAHAVLPMSLGAAGAAGPELGTAPDGTPFYRVGDYVLRGVRYEGSAFMDVDVRIAAMDAAGIDVQLLSPNPITYFGDLEPAAAAAYARSHNDALAELVRAHPGRLLGAAQLPMQDLDAAIGELERSVREVGLSAAYVDTDPGRTLDDPALDAFYEAVVDLDVPLFVHPSPLGSTGPADDPRLRRFDLDLLLGFAYDETLAVAALVFGGVLERHPRLDVCLSHGGGVTAYVAGRFGRAAAVPRAWVPEFLREHGVEHYLRRLWLDTHVHSRESLDLLTGVAGTDRLVFGTNFAGWDAGGAHAVEEVAHLAPVLSANARRLLRLDR